MVDPRLNKYINKFKTILYATLYAGVDVKKIDMERAIIYLDIPANSYMYSGSNPAIRNASDYAASIKQIFITGGFTNTNIKYREKNIDFKKEDSDTYFKAHIDELNAKISNALKTIGG